MEELENPRHEAFCHEYLVDLNQVQAYLRVYSDSSYDAARANSTRLITQDNVASRIKYLKSERFKQNTISSEEFMSSVSDMAMFDPMDVYEWDGFNLTVKKFEHIPIEARRMIKSVKEKKEFSKDGDYLGTSLEIQFWSKERFAEIFAKNKGLMTDKVESTSEIKINIDEDDSGL